MRSRFRVFASLAALFAFSASFAEGIWASTCGGVDSGDPGQMGAMAPMPGMDMGMDQMDMPMPESRGDAAGETPAPDAPDSPQCPLTAAMGSCAVACLPTYEPGMAFAPPVKSTERSISAMTPDLLLATALLRPPRA